jgi:uncharacterized phage-associated protein
MQIRFEFDPSKLVQGLVFFSTKGVSELTKLKAAKLFYFADKEHLLHFGRPILGDTYYCLDKGPIPSASLNLMSEVDPDQTWPGGVGRPFRDALLAALDVVTTGKYPVFHARTPLNSSVFSESEIGALEKTVNQYGAFTAGQLIELTHKEPTWVEANEGRLAGSSAEIPYELFFDGQPEEIKALLPVIEEEQAQRDFARSL